MMRKILFGKTAPQFLLVMVIAIFSTCQENSTPSAEPPQLGGWDYEWMTQVKNALSNGDTYFKPAYDQLIEDAEKALTAGPFSVTYKKLLPPSGSKHDYMSMGPYWWPDPEKEDGLPYIRRDGEINPERNETDRPQLSGLINNVRTLSLAWYYSDKKEYAAKAADLLRVWFLDKETFMNPHLEYAQAIPGRTPGRFIGVIDATGFHSLVDAIALLETADVLTEKEKLGIREWFKRYLDWLVESEHGKNEDAYKNNHSVAYDVHSSGVAYFVGDKDFVARKVKELPRRRIDPMIEADGRQPHELIRTKAYSYSVHNLNNFFNVGEKGLKIGANIFHYKNVKGGSLEKALDYLIGFVGKESEWPYEQITSWQAVEDDLGFIVWRAARIYEREDYQKLWETVFYERLKTEWSLLVIPGIRDASLSN